MVEINFKSTNSQNNDWVSISKVSRNGKPSVSHGQKQQKKRTLSRDHFVKIICSVMMMVFIQTFSIQTAQLLRKRYLAMTGLRLILNSPASTQVVKTRLDAGTLCRPIYSHYLCLDNEVNNDIIQNLIFRYCFSTLSRAARILRRFEDRARFGAGHRLHFRWLNCKGSKINTVVVLPAETEEKGKKNTMD